MGTRALMPKGIVKGFGTDQIVDFVPLSVAVLHRFGTEWFRRGPTAACGYPFPGRIDLRAGGGIVSPQGRARLSLKWFRHARLS